MTNLSDQTNLIPPHGGYQTLQSFQMSEIVHDALFPVTKVHLNMPSHVFIRYTLWENKP